jgi:phenylacetate-CoA ligase
MRLRKIARKVLPPVLRQRFNYIRGYIPLRFRYGEAFWRTYNFLKESQWWSKEKLEEYQITELSRLLNHAYTNVPYYRRIFGEMGLKPKNIQSVADLKQLPCLTKDSFKQNSDELVSINVDRNHLIIAHTSGTTGRPLQFYEEHSILQKESAFIRHQWSRVGFKPGDPLIGLRGSIIEGGKLFEYNPYSNILRLSPKLDTRETIYYYLEKIKQFGANFIHGYPSTIGLFAIMIKKYGLSVPFKVRATLFSSEFVYPWERQVSEEVFNCRAFSHYGMAENAVLGAECEQTHHYHCLPQYGITEVSPGTNEIIGTSFLNYVNPFVRYRTTDIASEPIYSSCALCGRQYPVILSGVEGRIEDFIVSVGEVPISPAVITHPFKDLKTIKDTQLVQKSIDYIQVRVVPWDGFETKEFERELRELSGKLRNILGQAMKIETEIVMRISNSKSGKFKWIISEVSKDIIQRGLR